MAGRMCPVCGSAYGPETGFCAQDGARLLESAEASSVLADQDPLVRSLIGGRYRVLKRLGEGGMGMVYLAEHEAIEKRVAVKVLKDQYAQREDVVARFQQEAKSASRVKHEGILEVFDFGRTDDGRFFLAMELLDGADLAHMLEKEQVVEPARTVRLGIRMARALAAAHQKGVIHRDMKPENVFVRTGDDGYERIKIVDFGIAQLRADGEGSSDPNAKVAGRKLTKTGMIFGTPEYMSPEQASGKAIDLRVDVYALGVILFEMLTGRTPFQGETFMAILSAHLMHPIPALVDCAPQGFHCTPDLEAVVRRALAKEPDQRYRHMNELAEALLMTPEGAVAEARVGEIRSSQFPSGLGGGASVPGTDYRMRSQAPPPGQYVHTPPPPGFAPSVPHPPAQSTPPPPVRGGPSTLGGYMGSASPAHDVGAATLYSADSAPPRPNTAEGATLGAQPLPKKSGGGAIVAVAGLMLLAVIGTGGYFGWRALGGGASGATPATPASAATNVASTTATTATHAATEPAPTASAPTPDGKTIVVHVDGDGLVEKKVGGDWVQVCDKAPCDLKVDPGTTTSLRLSKNGVAGAEKKVLVDHEQKLVLSAPMVPAVGLGVKPKPSASAVASPGANDLCEVTLDEGIKVWRPCAKK